MNTSQLANLRKFLPALGVLIALLIVGLLAYLLVVRPQVIVTAPVDSTITVTGTNGALAASATKTTGSTTALAVGSGTYSVTVAHGTAKQQYAVTLNLFERKQFTFDASAALNSTLVARQSAYNAFPLDTTSIAYLNTTTHVVQSTSAAGRQTTLAGATTDFTNGDAPTGNVYAMSPIAGGLAIVQTNSRLFVLQHGQLTPLNTTGFPSGIQSFVIGANTNQSSFVVAANQSLFWYASPNATPQKIVDLSKRIDQLAYGGGRVIAYSTRMPETDQSIKSAYSAYAIDPIVVTIDTKDQRTLLPGPIVGASIAPDGNHATVQTQGPSSVTSVYNLANSTLMYSVQNFDLPSPLWLDATHYVFTQGSDIWKYDINAHTAVTVGTLPDSLQPTSVTFNATTGTYLVTTYNDATSAAIYRLSTASTDQNATAAAALASSAPTTSQLFSFAYVNVTTPTLLIQTSITDNNPSPEAFANETRQSRQAALRYLQDHHIDTSKLSITYNPADPLP